MSLRRAAVLLLAAAVSLPVAVVPTGASAAATGAITRVRATAGNIVVSGNVGGTGAVDVRDLATGTVAGSATPVEGSFTVTLPRYDSGRDRYYSGFEAVEHDDGSALGGPHYVDDVAFAATNDYPYPDVPDKKGLQVEMTDDAEQLGVRHAAINVAFNSLMRLTDADPADTIAFDSGGQTYWFSRSYVASLDSQIKPLSDDGTLVNLILLLYRDTDPGSAFAKLVHPDAAIGDGSVYAFDTKTATGTAYFTAAMRFLTQRYTRTDQRYGRALGYIVGNEVDSAWVWQNMGDQSAADFVDYYSRALRIAWLAAREAYSHARVYVSLDHEWTVAYDPSQPTRYYPGKDLVDRLAALTAAQGDFDWDIAYHPYPQDLTNPAFWNDTQATADPDTTPLITFKNIQALPQYLQRPDLEFAGAPRRIILSEQGCNARSNSVADQQLQAACYAYAYYKVRFLPGIDAFILHRHVDHQAEGGLHLGLWTWDSARSDYAMPGTPKLVYDVFRDIDTARSLAATKFALTIIGARDWAQLVPGFDAGALDQRTPTAPAPLKAGTVDGPALSTFADGTDGWQPADNASSVERVPDAGGALRVHFDAGLPAWSTDATTWKGAAVPFATPVDAGPALGVAVRVPSTPGLATVQAQVRCYGADGSSVAGTARLRVGAWSRLRLDLSHWAGRSAVARIKVWVRAAGDADWPGTFDLDDVTLGA